MKRSISILTKSLIFTFLLSAGFSMGAVAPSEAHLDCFGEKPGCEHHSDYWSARKARLDKIKAAAEVAKKKQLKNQYEGRLKIAEEQQRKKVEEQKRRYNRTKIRPGYAKRPVYKGSVSTQPLASKSLSSRFLRR